MQTTALSGVESFFRASEKTTKITSNVEFKEQYQKEEGCVEVRCSVLLG